MRLAQPPTPIGTNTVSWMVCAVLLLADCSTNDTRAPLQIANERLLLARVEVSGADGWFLLDTGSGGSIVSPELASKLEPANESHRLSGFLHAKQPIDVDRVKSGEIRFAGGRLKYPEEVSVLDLGFLADWAGTRVDGILGWDVLREYVWGIDVRHAHLIAGRRLSPAKVLEAFGVSRADATVGIGIADERPRVTAEVEGRPLRLGLDTGAARTLLSAHAWKRLGLELGTDPTPVVIRGVNGDDQGYLGRRIELHLGPLAWSDIEVVVTDTTNGDEDDGLLGMDLLSDYLIVVDGPSRTLSLASYPPERG